jgi:hypothetical protein
MNVDVRSHCHGQEPLVDSLRCDFMVFSADIMHDKFQANVGLDMISVRLISEILTNAQ